MIKVQVVCSEDIDELDAAKELVVKGRQAVGDEAVQGILFFTSLLEVNHQAMLTIIGQAFPQVPLVGCTTDGEISGELGQTDDTSTLVLLLGQGFSCAAAALQGLSNLEDEALAVACREAQQALAAGLPSQGKPRLCLAFPDGLVVYQKPIIEKMVEALGEIPLYGGAAGDDFKFNQTKQFFGGQVLTDAMPLLLLGGDFAFAHGTGHGWNPVSQLARVTKSDYNKVYEIDGLPVLEYYQRYLGDNLNATPGIFAHFALIVLDMDGGGSYLRDPILPVPEEKALLFAGHVPEGAVVRLAEIGREEILEAVAKSAAEAWDNFSGSAVTGALVFSCASRRNVLGSRVGDECRVCQETLTGDIPLAGFYGFGEIAPLGRHGNTILHNDAFVVLLLGNE